jgi:hypothetical protein
VDFQEIEMEVGEWYEQMGTYCVAEIPEERCMVQASLTEQGCVLKLRAPGKPEVDVYVERLGDSHEWRINITPDHNVDMTQVVIGEIVTVIMD